MKESVWGARIMIWTGWGWSGLGPIGMGEGQGWMYKAFLGHRHERSPVSDLKNEPNYRGFECEAKRFRFYRTWKDSERFGQGSEETCFVLQANFISHSKVWQIEGEKAGGWQVTRLL